MGLEFTSDARPPSNVTLLPNKFVRPEFGALYGFDADVSGWNGNTYSVDFDGTNDHAITSGTPIDQGNMSNGYTFSGWVS